MRTNNISINENKSVNKGECCYCGEYKKLCKAHIIPQCLIKSKCHAENSEQTGVNAKNGKLETLLTFFPSNPKEYDKVPQTGYYDSNILCSGCDSELGCYDEYLKEFFEKDFSKYKFFEKDFSKYKFFVSDGIPKKAYRIPSTAYDYTKLKQALISVLWKTSISKLDIFKNLSLGKKYNNLYKDYLQNKIPDIPAIEIVWVVKLIDYFCRANTESYNAYPIKKDRYEPTGSAMYRMILCGYCFIFKVDHRIISDFSDFKLTEERLIIMEYHYTEWIFSMLGNELLRIGEIAEAG